jgi:hypothetical protein
MFCRSLFVLLSFFFWSLYCLSFDLLLLITSLVSSHFWSLYCLSFDLLLLITSLVSSHFWSLYCLSFHLLLITSLVSSNPFSFQDLYKKYGSFLSCELLLMCRKTQTKETKQNQCHFP